MYTQARHHSVLDHPWRIAALVAVVANVTFNYANDHLGRHTLSVAEVSEKYPTLFTPAPYAFAIWGVIYGATLLYSVLALLPNQLEVRFHDRVAPWLVLTNALASLWLALFSAEQLGPSVLIIGAIVTSCVVMYSIASDHLMTEHLSHWWRVPFGLWLGWLSVAALANLSTALVAAGWDGWPLSPPVWAAVMLAAALLVALVVDVLFLDPVVAFVVSWAAAAIAVQHWQDSTLVAIFATLVAIKALFLAGRVLLFGALPMPRIDRDAIERSLRFGPRAPHRS
jgi:translocator protein